MLLFQRVIDKFSPLSFFNIPNCFALSDFLNKQQMAVVESSAACIMAQREIRSFSP